MEFRSDMKPVLGRGGNRKFGQKKRYVRDLEVGRAFCVLEE